MSLGNLKLKRITTGSLNKVIESSDQAHILQMNDPNLISVIGTMVPNKFQIFDPIKENWIGNIFKSSSFTMEHSNMPKGGEVVRSPKSAWKHIAQCADTSFNLKEPTISGVSWTYTNNPLDFTPENLAIAMYNPDEVGIPATNFNATSSVWVFLSGLPFNFISNQPLNTTFYDYDLGILDASSVKTKNMYNHDYSVSARFIVETPTDTIGQIVDTRDYTNVRNGGNDIWMSYTIGSALSGRLSDTTITSGFIQTEGTPIIEMTEYQNLTSGLFAYEMVERFKGIVLLESTGIHKSNVFSIRITDSKLNNAITDTELREFIQNGINTVIKELMTKITPANTQLFSVIWEGE